MLLRNTKHVAMVVNADTTKYGLSKAWGTCTHVTSATGTVVPATFNPASCEITEKASLKPAEGNGWTVFYKDPLFASGATFQNFGADGNPK